MLEIGTDRFVDEDIRVDEKKLAEALGVDEITQGEVFLVAEENPGVLVVWEIFVGEKLSKLASILEVVFVSVVFDPEIEAIASVAEQDQPALGIRTAGLRDGVSQIKAVAPVNEDDGRWHGRNKRLILEWIVAGRVEAGLKSIRCWP